MSSEIANILEELRRDHRNMALLLDVIEREANCIGSGSLPDFELMRDIMQYMTAFPDAVHHPKEDRLYGELKTVRPDLATGFRRITLDHRAIAEQGLTLRDQLASVDAGAVVRRERLVAAALRYVNTLRSHMQWEEIDLFRRCAELAADGHRLAILGASDDDPDPLFGAEVDARYARLFERIRAAMDSCVAG